jgi:hypothetical protein
MLHDPDDPPPIPSVSDFWWGWLNRCAEECMRFARIFGLIVLALMLYAGLLLFLLLPAHAQSTKYLVPNPNPPALIFPHYRDWASHRTPHCINCRPLSEYEWAETDDGLEVLIDGQWCSVRPEHHIIKGLSPRRKFAHACFQPFLPPNPRRKGMTSFGQPLQGCARLLCFTGVPKR